MAPASHALYKTHVSLRSIKHITLPHAYPIGTIGTLKLCTRQYTDIRLTNPQTIFDQQDSMKRRLNKIDRCKVEGFQSLMFQEKLIGYALYIIDRQEII